MRHYYAASRRKHAHYARPYGRDMIVPRPQQHMAHGQPDPFAFELLSVVGWEDTGRLVRTVLDREDAERLRDRLTALLSAHVDHEDGHN